MLEEFETEGQFEEGKDHLHGVEPAAALHVLQELGEHGQEGEGKGKADAEAQHGDQRDPAVSARGGESHEGGTEDGTGAAETHQHGGQGNEEGGQQATFVGLLVATVDPFLGHFDFKETEEAQGEDEEDDEEDEVGNPVCAQDIERFGAEDEGQNGTQHGEEEDNAKAEEPCLTTAFALVFSTAHEEVDGHRYHWEDTGREHGEDAATQGDKKYHQQALVAFLFFLFGFRSERGVFWVFRIL